MKSLPILILLFVTLCSIAQEKTITGTVVDERNMPLPGANVVIKGTTTGGATNFEGKYSIRANNGDVLIFSYVGYVDQFVTIGASNSINISLLPDSTLDAVVVTAFSIKKSEKAIGYAVTNVKGDDLAQDKEANLVNALAGKVAGVEVTNSSGVAGASSRIVLRGASSITATQRFNNKRISQSSKTHEKLSNSSRIKVKNTVNKSTGINRSLVRENKILIVLDDVIASEAMLKNINPNSIKGLNVLKGVRGAALYGSKGTNGVIVVSTKHNSKKLKKDLDSLLNNYKNIVAANESYEEIQENNFERTYLTPLSTFSIDVDKASYSNVRRMINNGQKVNPNAVKIEEFINYFEYNYPQPDSRHPFSITTEVNPTPWNKQTKLVRIGLQGKTIAQDDLPASNLVFLIDVSGSMGRANKLGLLKKAFKFLINQLREKDTVSIVVYAGAAGVVLAPTSGANKQKIMEALNKLTSGGSTAGGQGIELAYKIAQENFIKKGNNRIILATDGDFNVGTSSDKEMEKLIEQKRKSGVFLTCLGFGYGNYKDSKLEILADKGNGNHGYIDNMQEAQKMFGKEFGGTVYTIAKDVKIQVEFNPAIVEAYRLIGYENRLLNDEDFIDDTKDAGELGSGHSVTALYEIILKGTDSDYLNITPKLKYTKTVSSNSFSKELLTVKFRYKKPNGKKSIEIIQTAGNKNKIHDLTDFNFSSAVALFGMQLRNSKYTCKTDYTNVIALAEKGSGLDKDGYRAEFIRLVKTFL